MGWLGRTILLTGVSRFLEYCLDLLMQSMKNLTLLWHSWKPF